MRMLGSRPDPGEAPVRARFPPGFEVRRRRHGRAGFEIGIVLEKFMKTAIGRVASAPRLAAGPACGI